MLQRFLGLSLLLILATIYLDSDLETLSAKHLDCPSIETTFDSRPAETLTPSPTYGEQPDQALSRKTLSLNLNISKPVLGHSTNEENLPKIVCSSIIFDLGTLEESSQNLAAASSKSRKKLREKEREPRKKKISAKRDKSSKRSKSSEARRARRQEAKNEAVISQALRQMQQEKDKELEKELDRDERENSDVLPPKAEADKQEKKTEQPKEQAKNDAKKDAKEQEESKTGKKDKKGKKGDKETDKKGRKLPPIRQMVTSHFGERRPGGITGVRFHGGLDIRAHLGWPVVAFKSGKVVSAGYHGRAGIMVELEHPDGRGSAYAHLQTATVKVGQTVNKGDKIGEVGCTGYTTGAHLHFVLYDHGHSPVDPLRHLASADEILRPDPGIIPSKLGPQQCNGQMMPYTPAMGSYRRMPRDPLANYRHSGKYGKRHGILVIRSRSGKTIRVDLNALRQYRPQEIPLWNTRYRRR